MESWPKKWLRRRRRREKERRAGPGEKVEHRFPNQGLMFGCRLIVGASGYLAPFRRLFCLDWFLLWASERLICQMHKALHICPVSPPHEVDASLFISHFASSSLLRFISPLQIGSPLFLLFVPMHLFFFLLVTIVQSGVQDFFSLLSLPPFVFIITQRALLAQHQDCHQLLLFHFLTVFLLFFVFPFIK